MNTDTGSAPERRVPLTVQYAGRGANGSPVYRAYRDGEKVTAGKHRRFLFSATEIDALRRGEEGPSMGRRNPPDPRDPKAFAGLTTRLERRAAEEGAG